MIIRQLPEVDEPIHMMSATKRLPLLGITGPRAVGKSTLARFARELIGKQFMVIDSDWFATPTMLHDNITTAISRASVCSEEINCVCITGGIQSADQCRQLEELGYDVRLLLIEGSFADVIEGLALQAQNGLKVDKEIINLAMNNWRWYRDVTRPYVLDLPEERRRIFTRSEPTVSKLERLLRFNFMELHIRSRVMHGGFFASSWHPVRQMVRELEDRWQEPIELDRNLVDALKEIEAEQVGRHSNPVDEELLPQSTQSTNAVGACVV